MRIFTFILFILVICKFCILHYWCILHYCIFYGDCYNVLASLVFIVFYSTVFKYGYNNYDYLRVIFRVLCYFMFGCFFFLVFALLLCLCVNILHVFCLFTNSNDYNSSTGSTFFHIHANIDKDANCYQSNNNTSSKNHWLLFSASFLFLKIWFNKSGNITFRFFYFYFFICCFFCTSTWKPQIIRKL